MASGGEFAQKQRVLQCLLVGKRPILLNIKPILLDMSRFGRKARRGPLGPLKPLKILKPLKPLKHLKPLKPLKPLKHLENASLCGPPPGLSRRLGIGPVPSSHFYRV